MKNPGGDNALVGQTTGCTFSNADTPPSRLTSPMTRFPDHDLFGSWTNLDGVPAMPTGGKTHLYAVGDLYKNPGQCNANGFDSKKPTDACQMSLASWQAAAHQAWKIWNQIIWDQKTQTNIPDPGTYLASPMIFTIGFDNGDSNDKADHTLLRMIANDLTSPAPFSDRVNGKYHYADGPTAVDYAFPQISSQILRLSQ